LLSISPQSSAEYLTYSIFEKYTNLFEEVVVVPIAIVLGDDSLIIGFNHLGHL
jgi:hypothetical protein